MNIKLSYLYRDAGNHKNFGEVVFENPQSWNLETFETIIRSHLIEEQWFVAKDWELPELYFEDWDSDLDHGWHEFDKVEYTISKSNTAYSLNDFFKLLNGTPRLGP